MHASILVTGAEGEARTATAEALERAGYAVRQAGDGHECLRIVQSGDVAMVLADVATPGLDGLEICRRIKGNGLTETVAVALVSAEEFSSQAHEAGIAAGADEYIWRPCQEDEFLTRVRGVMRCQMSGVQLRRALDQAREIITKSPAVVFRWRNAEGWPVEFVTPNVEDLFGHTEEQFLTGEISYASVVHPDDLDRVFAEVQSASRDTSCQDFVHFPYRIVTRGGEVRWVDDRTNIQRDADGKVLHYQGIVLDVTDRISAEHKLSESERRQTALLGNLPGMAYRCRNDRHWTMVFLSDGCERITGHAPADLIDNKKLSYNDLIHPEDREQVWKTVQEGIEADLRFEIEYRIIRADGAVRWIWEQGIGVPVASSEWLALEGYITDVTEQREAQIALRKEEKEKALVLGSLSELVVLHDTDLKVIWANRAAYESVKMRQEDVIARHCYEIWQGSQEPCPECPVLRALETGGAHDAEMGSADGRWWHVKAYPIKDDNGEVLNVVEICLDITERMVATREQESLREQLASSQKLEAVGRLAGGVAHDFNNMLTVINNYGRMMQESLSPYDPMYEDVAEINRAAQRATDLTRQLLAFSRKQIIQPKVIDLNESVEHSEKMLRRLIGEDIELVFRPGEDLQPTKFDPGQVEQILFNLAVNARDAMPDGGRLTIATQNIVLDQEYKLTHDYIQPGSYVMLAISDSGSGMDVDTAQKVFEPFFTTKETGKGTGLGLSTVYGIVKQHDGTIEVYSEPDHGTSFKIYLPAVDAQVDDLQAPRLEKFKHGSETILLVEDADDVRRVARRILEALGYAVLEAPDGQEALPVCRNHPRDIDLLLTDVIMPGISGKECFEKLKQERPDLKVLYMSGFPEDVIAQRGVLEEGTQLLQKPFSLETMSRKVRRVLDG